MPIAIFQKHPRLRTLAINSAVVFVFAAVIVGIVLGAVLPNRGTKNSVAAVNTTDVDSSGSSDSSSSSFESSSTESFSTGMSTETTSSGSENGEPQQDWISSTPVQQGTSLNTIAVASPLPSAVESDNVYLEGVAASIAATAAIPDFSDNVSSKKTWTVVVTVTRTKSKSQSAATAAATTTSSAVVASSPVATSATYTSVDTITNSNNTPLWGLTYSPYNTDGSCPDVGTVAGQLAKVAAVTSNIRLYSTDCSQLSNALQAITSNNLNLNIHAGIWISNGDARMQSDLNDFVSAAKQYGTGLIKGVSVGNEDISKGMSESTLIGYINQVRARLQAEGLGSIPVYTTEQDAKFTSGMAAASDLVQINVYSIFDGTFASMDASVQSVIQRANSIKSSVAGGKQVRFGETGWSSAGSTGPSPLSLANEILFAQKIKCAAKSAGLDYFYFEAKDAQWKQGESASEQSFGIFNSGFTPKFDFSALNVC